MFAIETRGPGFSLAESMWICLVLDIARNPYGGDVEAQGSLVLSWPANVDKLMSSRQIKLIIFKGNRETASLFTPCTSLPEKLSLVPRTHAWWFKSEGGLRSSLAFMDNTVD